MRFIAFENAGRPALGLREGVDALIDLTAQGLPATLDEFLRLGDAGLAAAQKAAAGRAARVPLEGLTYLPPIAAPQHAVAVGLNYLDHAAETKLKVPEYPVMFSRFATSWVAHQQPIVRPRVSDSFDFEAELVAIIGKAGRYIDKDKALGHVAGYALFNEGTVREFQFKSPQWMLGKNFWHSGGFGPEFVTADELPPGAAGLKLEGHLNGQRMQEGNTRDLIFDVATLVHTASQALHLQPGDMIITGTPAGVGWARQPRVLMQSGDRFQVSAEGFLPLVNPVQAD